MSFPKKMKGSGSNPSGKIGSSASRRGENLSGTETGNSTSAVAYVPLVRSSRSSQITLGDPVYVVYFSLGAGYLLPWNAFITAVDYFDFLYPHSHIDRIFSVAYLIPCLIVLALLVAYGQHLDARARINWGLGLFFISILIVPLMEVLFINGRKGSSQTYFVTVCAVALSGVGDALVQGTLMGSASQLSARYIQAIVSGTGFSGVLVSFLRIVTKEAFSATPSGLRASANMYFIVSTIFLVLCTMSYNAVHRLTDPNLGMGGYEDVVAEGPVIKDVSNLAQENSRVSLPYKSESNEAMDYGGASVVGQDSPSVEQVGDFMFQKSGLQQLLLQVKWLAAALVLTYVITLAIFPGFLTEEVKSAFLGDWYPVLLLTCYNVFDLVGKSLPAGYVPSKQVFNFGWAAARLLFFPFYSACVHGPRIFRTETPVFVLTALLGLTNGYLTTCFFLMAPKRVNSGTQDTGTAGVVMVMALEVGLTLGSLLSWVWVV